jgi:hypothetical protein
MRRIDTEIIRVSRGRLRFDLRHRELSTYDEDGRRGTTVQISETDLRNWLQRLLFAATPREGLEPHETAILALVDRLAGSTDTSRPVRPAPPASARAPEPVA